MVGDVSCELRVHVSGHGGSAISCCWISPSMRTSSWAALGDAAGTPSQLCPQEQRVPERHCQLLGCFWWIPPGSPFPQQVNMLWVTFTLSICQPPADQGTLTLVKPVWAGDFVWMLTVLYSWGLWIHQVYQSPEPSSLWEHSTDLPSFVPSLLFAGCSFCKNVHRYLQRPFIQTHTRGSLYSLVPFLYATLRAKKEIGPSLWQTPGAVCFISLSCCHCLYSLCHHFLVLHLRVAYLLSVSPALVTWQTHWSMMHHGMHHSF